MTRYGDALKRLQVCRDNQPNERQVVVAGDIVDALLETPTPPSKPCDRCNRGTVRGGNGTLWRCTFCRGTGRVTV